MNGRLVEAGNVQELSAAILEAATDPHKTIDVWRRGLLPVRSMDDIARDYMTMYAA